MGTKTRHGDHLCLSHGSALAFWRVMRDGGTPEVEGRATFGSRSLQGSELVDRARRLCRIEMGQPLHACVARSHERARVSGITSHVWRGAMDAKRVLEIERGLSVCRPEVAYVQLATTLDEIDLAILAYELTGTYYLRHWDEGGGISNAQALTTIEDLASYASSCRAQGVRGGSKALQALRHAREGSNSPVETQIALLMALPRSMGGFGLRGFELNKAVRLSANGAALLGRDRLRPDIVIRAIRLALEYDSNERHLDRVTHARDARRRAALAASGYEVLTITRGQLASFEELETIMELIARRLGMRRRRMKSDSGQRSTHRRVMLDAVDPIFG